MARKAATAPESRDGIWPSTRRLTGEVWAAVTGTKDNVQMRLHLVRFRPGRDRTPKDIGPVALANPDYTEFVGKDGKPLANHHGFIKTPDAKTRSRFGILGVAQGLDVKIGHFFSLYGVETTDTINTPLFSHAYTDLYDPFTHTGILTTTKLSDAWAVQAYGRNLTDTRGELSANYSQWYKAVTVEVPRTLGLTFSYKFRGT